MRHLKERGVTMVYISHRMDEIMEITDRITVMRDGEYVKTMNTAETTLDEIIHAMVGRTIYEEPKTVNMVPADAPVVLEARGLCSKDVRDISFQLHKGEILGFAGLMGAGRTEVARLLFGADPHTAGEILKNGQPVHIRSPKWMPCTTASAIFPKTVSGMAWRSAFRSRITRFWPIWRSFPPRVWSAAGRSRLSQKSIFRKSI